MSLVYDIPSLFLITSLFYILRAWKLESEHPRLLKTGVDCNQRLQLISKVEIFSNQWFRWSKKRCVIWTYASLFVSFTFVFVAFA